MLRRLDLDQLGPARGRDGLLRTVSHLHTALHSERQRVQLNMCPCGSCKKADDLNLKFVAHVGEVATQTIRRRKKPVGMDVIHVHRHRRAPSP